VRAVRIDSGDLIALSRAVRERLDAAGLDSVRILVSGGLDEQRIAALIAQGAPVDGFGVGTDLVVSSDTPTVDFAYKLVSYAGEPRMKGSRSKRTLPSAKQVFRRYRGPSMAGDTIAKAEEALAGEPLLRPVMRAGERLEAPPALEAIRAHATAQRGALPAHLRRPEPGPRPYPVAVSDTLEHEARRILARHRR